MIDILISALVGGLVVATATIAAEKLGSRIGGLIASLPSTVLIGILSIAIIKGIDEAVIAASAIPIGLVCVAFFLLPHIFFKKSKIHAFIWSFVIWFLCVFIIKKIGTIHLIPSILLFIVINGGMWIIAKYVLKIKEIKGKNLKIEKRDLTFRVLLGGSVIAIVVYLAKIGNPFIAGIAATFPAVYFSSLIILYRSSKQLVRSSCRTMLVSCGNLIVFALLVIITFPLLGILWGTIISFVGAGIGILFLNHLKI